MVLKAFLEKCKESPTAIISVNQNGTILSCSQVESIFGYSQYELVHKDLTRLLPNYQQHQESFNSTPEELPMANKCMNVLGRHQKGDLFWVSLQKSVIQVGTLELVSLQLKKMDLPIEIFFYTDPSGKILSCDPVSILHHFGYHIQDVMGCNLTSFISPICQNEEHGEKNRDQYSTKSNKKRKINADSSPTPFPPLLCNNEYGNCARAPIKTHFMHKDGSLVPIHFRAFPEKGNKDESFFCIKIEPRSEAQTSVGEYILLETIGRGSSGKVKRAIHQITGTPVAVKIINKHKLSPADIKRSQREAEIMKKLNHENIAKLHHVIDAPEKLYLVMELIQGIDLMKYVVEKGSLTEVKAKEIFRQLISALNYCHHMSVVHRDVKLKNILIEKETKMVKLIDFSLSNWNKDGILQTSYCGTPAFAAPEVILGHQYEGKLVDVWSAGVVLYFILTSRFPFINVGELLDGSYADPKNVSKGCSDVIQMMLAVDPSKRATLIQVISLPWCKRLDSNNVSS